MPNTTITPTPITGNYNQLRFDVIEHAESSKARVYIDTKGIATIGVGMNLQEDANVIAFIEAEFGITPDPLQVNAIVNHAIGVQTAFDTEVDNYFINNPSAQRNNSVDLKNANNAATSMISSTLLTGFNAVLAANNIVGSFEFTPDGVTTADDKIETAFNLIIGSYETALNGRLSGTPLAGLAKDTNEYLALLSLEYNGGNVLIDGLVKNSFNDRVSTWFNIRYNINAGGLHNRRYVESALFGLFNDPASVSPADAKEVVDFFLLNLADIQREEVAEQRSTLVTGAPYVGRGKVSITEVLTPISSYITDRFVLDSTISATLNGLSFDNVVLGVLGLDLNAANSNKITVTNYNTSSSATNDLLVNVDPNTGHELSGGYGNDVLVGNAKADTLHGGNDNDILIGQAGKDILNGHSGEDILDGGTGNDIMSGGKDNDTYYVDSLGDVITENAGEGDADTLISSIDYTVTSQHENIEVVGLDTRGSGKGELLTGNELDNWLKGNQLDNTIKGGKGADTLYGGEGEDRLEAGDEDVYGEGDINILQGGADNDTLIGGDGVDLLYGGTGDDTLFVDRGGLYVTPPATAATLGTEYMNGGEGFDTYYIGKASNLSVIEDSDGNGEIYVRADDIGDKTYALTGGNFWGEQTITQTGLDADGYTHIHLDGRTSELTVAYELDGSKTLIAFGFNIPNFYNGMLGVNLVGGRVDSGVGYVEGVLEKVIFDRAFTQDEIKKIKAVIRNAYQQSDIARNMLRDYTVVAGNNININHSDQGKRV